MIGVFKRGKPNYLFQSIQSLLTANISTHANNKECKVDCRWNLKSISMEPIDSWKKEDIYASLQS